MPSDGTIGYPLGKLDVLRIAGFEAPSLIPPLRDQPAAGSRSGRIAESAVKKCLAH